MQPIYNLFYFKNKLLDRIWKLNAVTLAAQVLTTPLSILSFSPISRLFFSYQFNSRSFIKCDRARRDPSLCGFIYSRGGNDRW